MLCGLALKSTLVNSILDNSLLTFFSPWIPILIFLPKLLYSISRKEQIGWGNLTLHEVKWLTQVDKDSKKHNQILNP